MDYCGHKFYFCKICGNLTNAFHNSGRPMSCCNEQMQELIADTTDASREKHVPEVLIEGDKVTVKVGAVEHPMVDAHYIQWIYLKTERGSQRKCLTPGEKPEAVFTLINDKALAAYEYCNLHSLWVKEL